MKARLSSCISIIGVLLLAGCSQNVARHDLHKSTVDVEAETAGGEGRGKPMSPRVRRKVEELKADDPAVRVDAARQLGAVGEEAVPAIPYLIEALTDTGSIDGPHGLRLPMESGGRGMNSEDSPAYQAAKALGKIGQPSVEPLIDAIRNHFPPLSFTKAGFVAEDYGPEHISDMGLWHAGIALSEIGNPAVEQLIAVLDDDERTVRIAAAWSLGRIGNPRAVEPLIRSLQDPDEYVRRGAAFALGSIKNNRALEALAHALNQDEDWHVRQQAADSLGRLDDKRAVEPLIAAMRRVDEVRGALYKNSMEGDVRRNAARSLGWLRDERAIEPLIEALGDEDVGLRIRAAYALGMIGDSAAKAQLANALSDQDARVRQAAMKAIGQINAR